MAVSKANNVKSDKQAEQAKLDATQADAKIDAAADGRESALSADTASPNPDAGVDVVVIKDGSGWTAPGRISIIGPDDDTEEPWGTWATVVCHPDAPERIVLDALVKNSEEDAREASRRNRRRYYAWTVESGEEQA